MFDGFQTSVVLLPGPRNEARNSVAANRSGMAKMNVVLTKKAIPRTGACSIKHRCRSKISRKRNNGSFKKRAQNPGMISYNV